MSDYAAGEDVMLAAFKGAVITAVIVVIVLVVGAVAIGHWVF